MRFDPGTPAYIRILGLLAIVLLGSGLLARGPVAPAGAQTDAPPDPIEAIPSAVQKRGKVRLELFVMLDCPYGIEAERMLILWRWNSRIGSI
jgi:hypothetical protein